ncbi:MAG: hypothetical protein M1832_004157 [Thelocarpon impressellum]|nr:MAG: hypothetical protein M1832_004157 [Thelocarpon impressellum]
MASKTLLITGATGKQGGAVISALLSSKHTPPFKILALTRNTEAASAKRLAEKPGVSLIKGDLDDPTAVFQQAGGPGKVWGVFSVQVPLGGKATPETEERQGKELATVAAENGVEHFVYTSVDRGGPQRSESNPTNVPHFISKHNIEQHLIQVAGASKQKMGWTILRVTAFFDNLTPDIGGKLFAAMWKGLGDTRLQFISTRDIGRFTARAFENPDRFRGQALTLAGDELNQAEANVAFEGVVGYAMPSTYVILGSVLKWAIKDMGLMFNWFAVEGFGADVPKLRKEDAELQDFATWLKDSSGFKSR